MGIEGDSWNPAVGVGVCSDVGLTYVSLDGSRPDCVGSSRT